MIRRILIASACAIALLGAAFAADLPARAPPPVYLPPPPLWTGFYAGLNAGYTFGGGNSTTITALPVGNPAGGPVAALLATTAAASATGVVGINNSGFIGGGQFGYNLQFGTSWVAGLEVDIQGTGARGSGNAVGVAPITGPFNWTSNIAVRNGVDYLGTVRGRLGFLWTPTLLIYGGGGFAYGGVHQNVQIDTIIPIGPLATFPAIGTISRTRVGWTAGGGFEWMFAPNWSAKLEYLYYDLGRAATQFGPQTLAIAGVTVFANPLTASTRFNGHIVRVGLNYHFNWGTPAPIVAKY